MHRVRLKGISLLQALGDTGGPLRERLIVKYLEAAARLGDLRLHDRGWFGQLIGPNPVRAPTWHGFLHDRASASLATAGFSELADPVQLAAAMPTCNEARFVHLDAFPGNVLVADGVVSAVIDISLTCLAGDRRIDPLAAAIYLATPTITPTAQPRDVSLASEWLTSAGLADYLRPARRWIAAFWSFGVGDPRLNAWCHSILVEVQ